MEFDQKLKNAYKKFKEKSSDEEKKLFHTLIKEIHSNVWQSLEGKVDYLLKSEFSHALSKLEPELNHLGKLPVTQSELALTLSKLENDAKKALKLRNLSLNNEVDKLKGLTRVQPDGTLLGTGKWELLDEGWLESLTGWFEHLDNRAEFNTNPVTVQIPDKVNLCIAGDWGTGYWRQEPISSAQAVGQQMTALAPDITLHLGDVYYAGTDEQEKNNLTSIWPEGRLGDFTLNSNHEMYNGAYSYFNALKTRFTKQTGCSYFTLENKDWLIIGLDSAYHSDPWNLYMDGKLDDAQINWLKSLPAKQGIIITSHHTGFDLKGEKQLELYQQVMDSLSDSDGQARYQQVYWYWGHAHNVVVYNSLDVKSVTFRSRCVGHAAIPYGNASELDGAQNVTWYETQSANDPDIPDRVLCGFVHVQLDGTALNEALIGENGSIRWSATNKP